VACLGCVTLSAQQIEAGPPEIPRELLSIPVLFEGRVMPLESAADLVLYRIAGRRSLGDLSAAAWFVRLLIDPFAAIEDRAILVDNPAVLPALGFAEAERGRYAYAELYPGLPTLREIARSLSGATNLDSTEQEIVRLANNLTLFEGLATTFDMYRRLPSDDSDDTAMTIFLRGGSVDPIDASELPGMLRVFPVYGEDEVEWVTPPAAVALLLNGSDAPDLAGLLTAWNTVFPAYLLGDEQALTEGSKQLATQLANLTGVPSTAVGLETFHRDLQPTRWAGRILLLGLVLFVALRTARRRVFWTRFPIGVAAALLTAHQVIRFIITHRPPVTDLPASFLFVAWLIVLAGFFLTFSRAETARVGVLLASIAGLSLIYLARLVSGGADPFGVVQAVLDTNFWLTTHVLVVTAGYAGVVAAGVAGHMYLFGRIMRPHRSSHQTTYRVMFVLMLSGLALAFLGTILGGVWADQSWGRFWGWDPKENGALLIVLWSAVALHARLTRWFDQAAFAASSIFGIVVVLFSWLGVNMMGVGLHSYGFNDTSFVALVGISFVEILIAAGTWLWLRFGRVEPGLRRVVIESILTDGDAALITIRGANGHAPGQHVGLKAESIDRVRAFSFVDGGSGARDDEDHASFLVSATGPLSTHLVSGAKVGDPLWMSEPAGDFAFSTPPGTDVVMVAGGVGIAPVLGMLQTALEQGNSASLVTACRDHTYLAASIEGLGARFPALRWIEMLSRPQNLSNGNRGAIVVGRISSDVLKDTLSRVGRSGHGADWYICGSPGFCDTARAAAQANGARRIHEEAFAEALDPPSAPAFEARVAIGLAGAGESAPPPSARPIQVRPGRTILAAALEAGVQIPHSCMSGTCRECACTVVRGKAVQGAWPPEVGEGDRLLTCVAYPAEKDGLEISAQQDSL